MSFKDAVITLIKDCHVTDENELLHTIESNLLAFDASPTHLDPSSARLLNLLWHSIFYKAQLIYGNSSTSIGFTPELASVLTELDMLKRGARNIDEARSFLTRSMVCKLLGHDNLYGVLISNACTSWESVFYELCHECIHLLSPATGNLKNEVQRLDEGVAVKFAEDMYRKYITPYCNITPINSPITSLDPTARHSQYYKAHGITSKISDDKLREVRSAFGSFWSIKDKDKFMSIVGDCITNEDADYLLSKFDYYSL
ncbi:hypothetical protein JI723_13870 [Providencia manganoxydans]|uniref:IrrE N-terminal-like domain-containing protein n=1 Tax=Providencia manganoxydans TaxID=2923283 RepID=A0ABX7ABW2_9GAMM|nr:hypothetical protein JI723_13870 [Providencia manganoxydans]